jgi:hypothetical protein
MDWQQRGGKSRGGNISCVAKVLPIHTLPMASLGSNVANAGRVRGCVQWMKFQGWGILCTIVPGALSPFVGRKANGLSLPNWTSPIDWMIMC